MSRCLNCSYQLVLLPNRWKYKCALCSKLYSQKNIDSKEFQEWNKAQREIDVKNYEKEYKKELKQLRELKKHIKLLFHKPWDSNEYYKKYYQKNKPKSEGWIIQNNLTKEYKDKIKHRLDYYRQKQKQLTLQYLKNCNEKLSITEIFKSPPTFYFVNYCKNRNSYKSLFNLKISPCSLVRSRIQILVE